MLDIRILQLIEINAIIMSIMKNGIFGHHNGRLGNLVFYTHRGRNVCRALSRYKSTCSDNQKINRKMMRVVMNLLKPLQDFIKIGFEHKSKDTIWNAFNLAVSHNKKYALKGDGLNIKVDYEKVLLSSGSLPATQQAGIEKADGGVLLNWDATIDTSNKAYGHDMALVVLYYPGSKGAEIYLNEAKRKDGSLFIPITKKNRLDEPTEAYLCFKSVDGERISDSVYLGNLNGEAETEDEKEEKAEYISLKTRLEVFEASFKEEQKRCAKLGRKTKNYKYVERKCKELKGKLDALPSYLRI